VSEILDFVLYLLTDHTVYRPCLLPGVGKFEGQQLRHGVQSVISAQHAV
jgi:hypothetical protein